MITKPLQQILSGILAGISIGIGCLAFLCIENKVVGSVAFCVGLFIVLVNRFALYTGIVCYMPNNPPSYLLTLLYTLIGNFIGATGVGFLIRATRMCTISQRALSIVQAKSSGGFLSTLILAAFCNLLIYFAVDCYKNSKGDFGKYLGILLCIPVFILCGFEHCVANMCYIAVANMYTTTTMLSLATVILGNTIGGVLIVLAKKCMPQIK